MFEMDGSTIRLLLSSGGLVFFLALELLVPYRDSSVSKWKRWANNLALTLFNSFLLQLIFSSAIIATAVYAQTHKMGILNMLEAPVLDQDPCHGRLHGFHAVCLASLKSHHASSMAIPQGTSQRPEYGCVIGHPFSYRGTGHLGRHQDMHHIFPGRKLPGGVNI
jgi:hypothetical protein